MPPRATSSSSITSARCRAGLPRRAATASSDGASPGSPRGSSNANIEPRPTVEPRSIRVPRRSQRRATMDKPRPRPAVEPSARRARLRRAARTPGTRLFVDLLGFRSPCPRPRCAALCASPAATDQHTASLRVADRIRDQVREDPAHKNRIAAQPVVARPHPQLDPLDARQRRELSLDRRQQVADREVLLHRLHGARVEL